MERQFTTSVYLVDKSKVLLIQHRKLNKWLPCGGHVEPNETPIEAAHREVMEESGYEIEILKDEHLWINQHNARSIERPFMCLLEEIPAYHDKPAHQHIDFLYVARPIKKTGDGDHAMRWFTLEEVEQLESDKDIFLETQLTIKKILEFIKGIE